MPVTKRQTINHHPVPRLMAKRRLRKILQVGLVGLVAGYALFFSWHAQAELTDINARLTAARREVVELQARQAALEKEKVELQQEAAIERLAREKLGMIRPGETLVVPVPTE